MAARLVALALTLVVTGAPVLTNVCEATCGARSADATHGGRGERHSCHQAMASNDVGISGVAHICGHSTGDDQIGANSGDRHLHSTVAVVSIVVAEPVPVVSVRVITAYAGHSPPGSFPETTQLRI